MPARRVSQPEATRAYLPDGRHVEVDDEHVDQWKDAVADGSTQLGLGEWYVDEDRERDEDEEVAEAQILGEADDEVRCTHLRRERGSVDQVRVVNASQAEKIDISRPHASHWVCARRACVLDALAWVERSTGEKAVWIDRDGYAHQTILGHGLIEHGA